MKRIFTLVAFTLLLSLVSVTNATTKSTEKPVEINSNEYSIRTVAERVKAYVYDTEINEIIRIEDMSIWRNINGYYEVKFLVSGWVKVQRSSRKGFEYYVEEYKYRYYFNANNF